MKNIFFFLFIILIISCNKEFNPNHFQGDWINNNGSLTSLPTITFKNDSVYFSDLYTYTSRAKFKIEKNKITYFLKKDTLIHEINFTPKDSTLFINKVKYSYYDGKYNKSYFTDYELINIAKLGTITTDSLSRFDAGFHLFKDKSRVTKLKLNETITSDFNELQNFHYDIHFDLPITVIYLGKDVKLIELIKCYYQWVRGKRTSMLITNYDFKTNTYNGLLDRFYFWNSQIDFYSNEKKEPYYPSLLEDNREFYLKKHNPKIIIINSHLDSRLLKSINKDHNYLISLNPKMNLKTYILIKQKVSEIIKKGIVIRTEFNLPPLN